MRLDLPDPDYAASRRASENFLLAIKLAVGFLALVWLVFALDQLLGLDLIQFGLRPREAPGLFGLVTTPLLHANFAHIASNSAPLFVGGVAMLFLYPNSSLRVLPLLYIGVSAAAWVFARPSLHIGASGLVYGMLAFVFVSGILRRDVRSVGVSLMVWFLYGSMIWGVFPGGQNMSWELHLSGLLWGLALAFVFRHWDQPPIKRYEWEDESIDEDNTEGNYWDDNRDDARTDGRSDNRTGNRDRPGDEPWRLP